jgi:hypothetical protein
MANKSSPYIAFAVMLALATLLGSYVGAYLLAGENCGVLSHPQGPRRIRVFGSERVAKFFAPLCWIESELIQRTSLEWEDPLPAR